LHIKVFVDSFWIDSKRLLIAAKKVPVFAFNGTDELDQGIPLCVYILYMYIKKI
jgi:hypothetical protein